MLVSRRRALVFGMLVMTPPAAALLAPPAQAGPRSGGSFPHVHAPAQGRLRCTAPQVAQLTHEDLEIAHSLIREGALSDDVVAALEGVEIDYEIIGPAPRALPVVAAVAVAAVAWCAKGALSSLPASAIQQLVNQANKNIPPPDWIMNAIFGCAGGPVIGALTSQWMRVQFAGAVMAMILRLSS